MRVPPPKVMVSGDEPLGGAQGRVPMSGISILARRTPGKSLTAVTTRGHSETTVAYEPGSGISPGTKSARVLILCS